MPSIATSSGLPVGRTRGLVVFELDCALLTRSAAARAGARWLQSGRTGRSARGDDRIQLAAERIKAARALRSGATGLAGVRVDELRLVPAAQQSIGRLQRHGIACALVSLGWDFVLEALAQRLGIVHYLGTGLEPSGAVVHVWPEDRADFTRRIGEQLRLPEQRCLLVVEPTPLAGLADSLIRRWR